MASVDMQAIIEGHLLRSADVKRATAESCVADIQRAADMVAAAFTKKKKLLLCGNGGSAADCQHMAAEFVSRLTKDFRRPALPAIALTTDTSFLTAFANDENFEDIFARQVEGLGSPGDVLFGISTSGTSANVLRAFAQAKSQGMSTILLTGEGGANASHADVVIAVPSGSTQHIQESHLAIEHVICDLVERLACGKQ